ncbi:carbohydrate ABC transporter permease [Paraburkholderia caballeronis]|uniref:Carbohydrate ABC transporter membrane protein 1, CUT1 family n=1 Tax=Paraburkholderia caballeronis TaxID=416943 RepID=A0A1H7QQL4_9BURK|nr:sugar ABC transporter permease [Paraburkholderia caballeronis]PXW22432.1 carbohydrate ABC transporter membrane protein 1 (CUT1 family) [Paraburkholderia caballeronis]PXW96303.1 carbohydrate ABC transporter membrane protein 1 (CUT1 family) [Paraburkholderia caballeronis]RAJ92714.1 carbohydrate ABC transporter membrane protein 1 (CUT1 family) [Paraburkholderia caballeronis]SEE00802.1 carbohydrate ABC transporter membrane protein 1, CUT1 family [Paraburkholderia caballeronis]SEL49998.1 carbohy
MSRSPRAAVAPRAPWLLIVPSLVLALFIISYPIFNIVYQSLHEVSRFGAIRGFSGLQNFYNVFEDPGFIGSLKRTVVWTVFVVGGTVLISVPVALVLNQDFYGRGLARTIVMLPWSVSLTMTAVVWRWAFNDDYGMVNVTLQRLGLTSGPIHWLATPELAFPVEIAVGILVSIPFTTTILLGGLSSVPGDIYEAARIDGASAWQQFRLLTLPLLKPFINMTILLNVIYVFNSFPIIWVMTQGGPDDSTHILVTYLYELGFRLGRPGEAAAVSLIMLAVLFSFSLVYLRVQGRRGGEQGEPA